MEHLSISARWDLAPAYFTNGKAWQLCGPPGLKRSNDTQQQPTTDRGARVMLARGDLGGRQGGLRALGEPFQGCRMAANVPGSLRRPRACASQGAQDSRESCAWLKVLPQSTVASGRTSRTCASKCLPPSISFTWELVRTVKNLWPYPRST